MKSPRNIHEGQYMTLFYHLEKSYLHVWLKASPKHVNENILKKELIQFKHSIQSTEAKIVVINIQNYLMPITLSCSYWLENYLLQAPNTGLQRVSIAYGQNIMTAVTLEGIIGKQKRINYALGVFSDEVEAIHWGHQLPKK